MIFQLKRSVVRGGIVINAKPIFILSLIELIRKGLSCPNVFLYAEPLFAIYYEIWQKLYSDKIPTPIYKPFYHLTNDGFWHIKWKTNKVIKSPTDGIMRNELDYGFLDNTLWDILQDEETRQYYEHQIKSYFFPVTK